MPPRPDLVDIVTPPAAHLAVLRAAAGRGIHVVCQKPLGGDLATAQAMVRQAEAAGIKLVVHENFRFMPWYREARRLIEAGALGRLLGHRLPAAAGRRAGAARLPRPPALLPADAAPADPRDRDPPDRRLPLPRRRGQRRLRPPAPAQPRDPRRGRRPCRCSSSPRAPPACSTATGWRAFRRRTRASRWARCGSTARPRRCGSTATAACSCGPTRAPRPSTPTPGRTRASAATACSRCSATCSRISRTARRSRTTAGPICATSRSRRRSTARRRAAAGRRLPQIEPASTM